MICFAGNFFPCGIYRPPLVATTPDSRSEGASLKGLGQSRPCGWHMQGKQLYMLIEGTAPSET
jgi:hypothetical protein